MPEANNVTAEIIRSKRKTIALQIKEDGRLVVRAPLRYPERDIIAFIEKNRKWIDTHRAKVQQRNSELELLEPFSARELEDMAVRARSVIPERVRYYSAMLGVTYGKVTIRRQKTKWGSCNAKGDLSFNCLLTAAPPEVLDSVVVHELCHRLHMDHSKAFYAAVYRVFPEYGIWDRWLRDNGPLLIRRMTAAKRESSSHENSHTF